LNCRVIGGSAASGLWTSNRSSRKSAFAVNLACEMMRALKYFCLFALAIFSSVAATTPGWRLVWSDEFNQPDGSAPASTNWVFETGGGGWGNNELESYTARRVNSSITNGSLVISALQETYTGSDSITRNYTSARLKSLGKHSWLYGRIEARMKLPKGQEMWP